MYAEDQSKSRYLTCYNTLAPLLEIKEKIKIDYAKSVAAKWKYKMKRIKHKRVQRAKLSFLYYSLQIFKRYVIEKTMKDIPRYMAKTKIKLGKEESEYYDKFKHIPPNYVRYKGIKYLKRVVALPIGPIETRPAAEGRKAPHLSKFLV